MSEDRLGPALAWCERYTREHGATVTYDMSKSAGKPYAVYVFRSSSGWCKVGLSYDLAKRREEVRLEAGEPVELVAECWLLSREAAHTHERACHEALDAYRLPGRERFSTSAVEAWLASGGLSAALQPQ